MARITSLLAFGAAILSAIGVAQAGDGNPPPWRGLPLTTTQGWQFLNGPGQGQPNMPGAHNPYQWPVAPFPQFLGPTTDPTGAPTAQYGTWQIPGTTTPLPGWCVQPGGALEFLIPNNWDPFTIKEVWAQIKYAGATPSIGGVGFRPDGQILSPGFPPLGGPTFTPSPSPVFPGMWEYTLRMQFDGNPAWEIIRIQNNSQTENMYIFQVVIDTICPTPGTAAAGLLGLGVLAQRRRR